MRPPRCELRLAPLLTRRAGCLETGSSSSREALTSNPFTTERSAICVPEGVIRGFYPIDAAADAVDMRRNRATEKSLAKPFFWQIKTNCFKRTFRLGVFFHDVPWLLDRCRKQLQFAAVTLYVLTF
jgi:hypothetical protein